jgi:hypothetical protein
MLPLIFSIYIPLAPLPHSKTSPEYYFSQEDSYTSKSVADERENGLAHLTLNAYTRNKRKRQPLK